MACMWSIEAIVDMLRTRPRTGGRESLRRKHRPSVDHGQCHLGVKLNAESLALFFWWRITFAAKALRIPDFSGTCFSGAMRRLYGISPNAKRFADKSDAQANEHSLVGAIQRGVRYCQIRFPGKPQGLSEVLA